MSDQIHSDFPGRYMSGTHGSEAQIRAKTTELRYKNGRTVHYTVKDFHKKFRIDLGSENSSGQ